MSLHQAAQDTTEENDFSYNLFRNREFPELVCAVPEDCPVPKFISPEQWTYEHALRAAETRPRGFHDKGAETAVRFNGFYLFYALAASPAVQSALGLLTGGT
jgi:hypothetical protein